MAKRRLAIAFWAAGIAVSGGVAAQAWLSRSFIYGEGHRARPILVFVAVFLASSAAYATSVFASRTLAAPLSRPKVMALWGLALFSRVFFLGSNPIQEDDFYRYLWDGNTVLAGVHPYRYAPEEVQGAAPGDSDAALLRLARERTRSAEARRTFERVNHPQLSTIYPPVSLAVFAISQWLAPWSLTGLRLVFMAFDSGTMVLLWRLLRRLGLPPGAWVAYAWCPLVSLSIVNTAHGDAVPVFFLVLSLSALFEARPLLASAAFSCAALAKLYPFALAPLFFARLARGGRKLAMEGLAVFALTAAAFCAAIGVPATNERSGLLNYAERWHNNGGLFSLFEAMIGGGAARLVSAVGALGAVAYATLRARRAEAPEAILRGFAFVLAAIFCLSPCQFPWYYVWLIPFLCFFPSAPWVLLCGLLGLYYLDFWIEYNLDPVSEPLGAAARRSVLLAEYLPFYVWLLVGAYRSSVRQAGSASAI
jgi:hypothetical protein